MKKIILGLLFIFFCASVSSQEDTLEKYRISEDNAGIKNNELRTDGYYYAVSLSYNKKLQDSVYKILPKIIYTNGAVLGFDSFGSNYKKLKKKSKGKKCILKPKSDVETILSFFECYISSYKYREAHSIFQVNSKSIKIQYSSYDRLNEKRGVILNDSTFMLKKFFNYKAKYKTNTHEVYFFKKFDDIPDQSKITINLRKKFH